MRDRLLKFLRICGFCMLLLGMCMVSSFNTHAASKDTELKKTKITSVAATDKGTVELKWKKVSGANKYEVYRKIAKQEKYTCIATTSKTKYTDKKGKANVTYIYRIRPILVDDKDKIIGAGKRSDWEKCKVRKKNPKIAYAGDSIMTGFTGYNVLKDRKKAKVFAAIGMNPKKFASSKEMKSLLKYNPDRLYIMLGVNSLWSGDSKWLNSMWKDYEKILKKFREKNPHMEIVVVGVAPVGKKANISKSAVNKFNKILKKKVPKKSGMYYCDIGPDLADSKGYLRSKYAAGDGVHWKSSTYKYVLKKWDKFSEKIYW